MLPVIPTVAVPVAPVETDVVAATAVGATTSAAGEAARYAAFVVKTILAAIEPCETLFQ